MNSDIGRKDDAEKCRLDLVDYKFVQGGGWILTMGALKYEPNNWKKFTPADKPRFIAAQLRHLHAYADGEVFDPESHLPHNYHIFCESMFADYMDRQLYDYRPQFSLFQQKLAELKAAREVKLDHE